MSPESGGPDLNPSQRLRRDPTAVRGNTLGRRKTDSDPRTTLTKKFVTIVVAGINLAYLVGELLLLGHNQCP